jgi:hypothetical protein
MLADAARSAEDAAVALEAHGPPEDVRAAHDELTDALKQFASDAREVAGRKDLHQGRQLLREVRDKPSYGRMVESWRAIREEFHLKR